MNQNNDDLKRRERDALVAEIVAELKKDEVKKSALAKLKSGWRHTLGEWFRHPAILVLLTFACTSVIGNRLASAWQSRQKALEVKYQVIDQLNEAFAESATGAQDILSLYTYEVNAKNRDEIEKERWSYWQQKSRDWRISSEIILQKLKVNFMDSSILTAFEKIKERQYQTSVSIKNLKNQIDETNWEIVFGKSFMDKRIWTETPWKSFKDTRTELLIEINDIKKEVGKLMDLMMLEIRES